MWSVLISAFVIFNLLASPAHSAMEAEQLDRFCEDEATEEQALACYAYITGYVDAVTLNREIPAIKKLPLCIPRGTKIGKLRQTYEEAIEGDPSLLDLTAGGALHAALAEAFHCN